MNGRTATGVQNILNGILSPENRRASTPTQEVASTEARGNAVPPSKTSEERQSPPVGARRGRPLGRPSTAAQPKTKVTLWLSSSIVASYRDWSWEARSQFSHLVETALIHYHESRRYSKSAPR
jgi:hypothetical protein